MGTGGDVDLTESRGATHRTTVDVVIEDDEDQTVRIRNSKFRGAPTNVYEPAGDPEISNPVFWVDAEPNRNDLPLEVRLDMVDLNDQTVSSAKISLSAAALTLNDGDTGDSDSVTVNLPASDGDREDDSYKLNASVNVYSVATGGYETIPVAEHAFTVIDRHKLPDLTVSPATATVAEGGMTELTLTINRNPSNTFVGAPAINSGDEEKRQYTDEEVSVLLSRGTDSTAGASDFSIPPASNPVTFPKWERGPLTASMKVMVEATTDDDIDDMEMLVLDAAVGGSVAANGTDKMEHAGVSTLTITEGTDKLVWAKAVDVIYAAVEAAIGEDKSLNANETAEIMGSALFNAAEGVSLSFTAESDNMDVVSVPVASGTVMLEAGDMAGMAAITVTAHASMPSGVTIATQTDPDEASVTFPVTVVLADLSVTVAANPMEIMEGGMSTITATASRMIEASDGTVKVDLVVVGDATLSAASITIAANMMSGSVVLTATQDDDYMDESLQVVATGRGIDGSQLVSITVMDDDAPLSPITAKSQGDVDAAVKAAVDERRDAAGRWTPSTPPNYDNNVHHVELSDLFDWAEGVTLTGNAMSSDYDVVGAWVNLDEPPYMYSNVGIGPEGPGTARVTVTMAAESATGETNIATLEFGVTVDPSNLTVMVTADPMAIDEGGTSMITATASRMVRPSDGAVTVNLSAVGEATLAADSITIATGSDSDSVMLTSTEDADAEDETVTVVASGAEIDGIMEVAIAVTDNDPTVTANSADAVNAVFLMATVSAGGTTGWLPGGAAAEVDMTELFNTNGSPTLAYVVVSSAPAMVAASASGSMLTLTPVAAGSSTISVTATDSSGDAADTASVMSMVTVGVQPLEVTLTPATAEVTEGGTVEITAMANKMVDANVEVMLMRDAASTAGEDDYSLAPVMITIMAGDAMGKATLTATENSTVEPTEMLTLVGGVVGMEDLDVGMVMVTIMDNDMETTYTLSGPMDMNIAEGMSAELTVKANQAVMANTEVMIMRDGASTAGDGDFTVASVMIMAGETMGTTMLMAVEDNMAEDMEMLTVYGMAGDMRTNSLSFNIWDAAVPALPLIAQLLLAAFLAIGGYRRYLRR